jgi:hypothetical protein
MTTRNMRFTIAILAVLITAGVSASIAQKTEPVHSMEGSWYGIVSITSPTAMSTPSLDTFTSDSQRHAVEGTFICTIPAVGKMPNPMNANGWLSTTASGHGNWVRIGKNKYAFTAARTVFDETGKLFGWAKFWGTITPISDSQYAGTMNAQYYLPNGNPFSPLFTGTLHSQRIEITFEQ